ncbi:uncharacterized protein, partial [Palaemon carinicauda]|uniref:uncharacterized protein n=1 Tax=Palaemon carinicauda TaxID=392227 RepID=UPI0035B649B6
MNTHNHNELKDLGQINLNAKLCILKEDEDNPHYFLKLPSLDLNDLGDVYNIAMIDVSGSMCSCWKNLMGGWNNHIAPKLLGTTHVYTFATDVKKRPERELNNSYFDRGMTNLTDALSTIQTEIYECEEKNINVLLVTDGHHTVSCENNPESIIKDMKLPKEKMCNVFILGIGGSFPVQYSIDIRSKLHNGHENIPSLFWAKNDHEIQEVIKNIGDELSRGNHSSVVSLNIPGFLLPGSSAQHDFHAGDWIYMPHEIENLDQFQIRYKNCIGTLCLKSIEGTVEIMEEIFCQWHSTLIKLHTLDKTTPKGVIDLENKIFEFYIKQKPKEEHKYSIKQRIKNNQKKHEDNIPYEDRFHQQLRKLENILMQAKYENEIQLAKDILITSVVRNKYKEKSFRLKGHTDVDYHSDVKVFLQVLSQNMEQIKNISVSPDECCRITIGSTVTDIQDGDLREMIETFDKFDFLKSFTISGIPVFAPTRDSVSLNPWSYSVKNIVTSPYIIMSQIALESYGSAHMQEGDHKK